MIGKNSRMFLTAGQASRKCSFDLKKENVKSRLSPRQPAYHKFVRMDSTVRGTREMGNTALNRADPGVESLCSTDCRTTHPTRRLLSRSYAFGPIMQKLF